MSDYNISSHIRSYTPILTLCINDIRMRSIIANVDYTDNYSISYLNDSDNVSNNRVLVEISSSTFNQDSIVIDMF